MSHKIIFDEHIVCAFSENIIRLEERLERDYDYYLKKAFTAIDTVKEMTETFGNIAIVSGEGATYIASKKLLWEEHSTLCWKLFEEVAKKYKEIGMWGAVVRTCLGPEDPAWYLVPDKILKVNKAFLDD